MVFPRFHQEADPGEMLEIFLLARKQGIGAEVRDDLSKKIIELSHFVFQCFVGVVPSHVPAPEVLLHMKEDFRPVFVLTYGEARSGFDTDEQFFPFQKRDAETTFTIRVSGDVFVQVSLC